MRPSVEVEEDRQRVARQREGSGSVTKERVLSSALALGVSRWSRTGRAGPGCPPRQQRLTLGDRGRSRFEEAVSALELRSRFIPVFIDCN